MEPASINPHTGQPNYSQEADGFAIASFICGLIGAVGCCCCPMRIVSIAAIICGHIGMARSHRIPGHPGRGIAIAGLILGYGMIILTVIVLILALISPEWNQMLEEYQQRIREAVEQHKVNQTTTHAP